MPKTGSDNPPALDGSVCKLDDFDKLNWLDNGGGDDSSSVGTIGSSSSHRSPFFGLEEGVGRRKKKQTEGGGGGGRKRKGNGRSVAPPGTTSSQRHRRERRAERLTQSDRPMLISRRFSYNIPRHATAFSPVQAVTLLSIFQSEKPNDVPADMEVAFTTKGKVGKRQGRGRDGRRGQGRRTSRKKAGKK